MTEILDVYDINGNKTGKTIRRGLDALAEGEYILFADVWIVNRKNLFLIQKRHENDDKFPGLWQSAAAGAVISGENSKQCAEREVMEELGVKLDMANTEIVNRFTAGNAIVNGWLSRQEVDINNIRLQKDEAADAKWVSLKEIRSMLDSGVFVQTIIPDLDACVKELGMD